MKIVILERNSVGKDIDISELERLGDVTSYQNSTPLEAVDRIEDAEVVVINKCLMNAETLRKASKLKLITTLATGYDVIDLEYCRQHGIAVANVRGYSTDSVAQHTFTLALSLIEKLPYYDNYVKSGKYANQQFFCHIDMPFFELAGKTWGVIGMGNIGQKVASIASAFGCKVIYYSTSGKHDMLDYTRVELTDLCRQSDVISIHCPLTEQTRGMVNREFISNMKNTAVLINVARGPIVQEDALLEALSKNQIAGVGLDVLSKEPMGKDNVLGTWKDSNQLIITPHMAWGSKEARQRLVNEVAMNIEAFLAGKERNLVL